MNELAYTINGDTFEVPTTVTEWRVRRLKPRGAPELVYGPDGRPLTLSIEAGLEELHDAVSLSGKYRLDPIGEDGKAVDGVPAAYIQVAKGARNAANDQVPERNHEPRGGTTSGGLDLALLEAVRLNTEALRYAADTNAAAMKQSSEVSMRAIDKFPELIKELKLPDLMQAMAAMLNVAAGTQLHTLPQREPQSPPPHRNDAGELLDEQDEDDENDEDDETEGDASPSAGSLVGGFLKAAGFDINKFATDVVASGFSFIHTKVSNANLPSLGAILAPRKPHAEAHGPAQAISTGQVAAAPTRVAAQSASAVTAAPPPAAPMTPPPPPVVTPSGVAPMSVAPSLVASVLAEPATAQHFAAVRKQLTPDEQIFIARFLMANPNHEEVASWIQTLKTMSVPEAVTVVRAEIDYQHQMMTQATHAEPPPVQDDTLHGGDDADDDDGTDEADGADEDAMQTPR